MDFNRIEELRKRKGLSQDKLAKKAGISTPGYQNIFQNQNTTIAYLEKISKALDVPMTHWWTSDETMIAQEIVESYGDDPYKIIQELRDINNDLRDDKKRLKMEVDELKEKLGIRKAM